MRTVTLVFPNTTAMADFILVNRLSKIEASSSQCTITGMLSEQLISQACTTYAAEVKKQYALR